jgi:prepilin-type N-terminal cleavage/methylation domain-containing protein
MATTLYAQRHVSACQTTTMKRRRQRGFTMLELMVATAIAGVLIVATYTSWRKYSDQQRLRYGVVQVASSLRQGEERAKAERSSYTITFTASSSGYVIQRVSGGFLENAQMPTGVTAQASDTVTFSAFGVPDAAHTITLQNGAGTKTATVGAQGAVTYTP